MCDKMFWGCKVDVMAVEVAVMCAALELLS